MNITFINRMMGINFGGGENFDLNIARALKKRGHNIRFVIGREWDKLSLPMDEDEFEVVYVRTPYLRDWHYNIKPTNFVKKVISVGVLELDLLMFENQVLKYLKQDTWSDVYQICGLPLLGAKLGGQSATKDRLISVRWPGPPSKRKLKWMRKCDINFANGDALKTIQEKLFPQCKEVNLGIDTKIFYPVIKKEKIVVELLFAGRVVPIKNLPFLLKGFIEASKENSNIVLKIVGHGDNDELEIIRNIAKSNKNIQLLGKKTRDDLIELYQESDVFCLTSNYDNYPNVIFEAMACGLPVIGTNVGGIPMQVVDGKTGILVELNNIDQLKNAILKLANDKELRENMGKKGREIVKKEFSWDESARKLEGIYLEGLRR